MHLLQHLFYVSVFYVVVKIINQVIEVKKESKNIFQVILKMTSV